MTKVTFADIEAAIHPERFANLSKPTSEGYENCARFAAKTLLSVARRDPVAFGKALDAYREDPTTRAIEDLMTPDERDMLFEGRWGLSGFMWGWACQTVAYLLEQEPVGNPALVTISSTNVFKIGPAR